MAIDFSCACGQKYSLPEALAGKTARCKKCGVAMTIPSPFAAREAIRAAAEGGGHASPKKIDDVEVVEVEQSKAVVEGEPPVVVTPEEESEGAEPAAPLWCEGYYDHKNAQRFCRIYRAGDELLFLDAGPRFTDKREISTRAGGAAGGVIGAAIGMAAGSIANKLSEGQKEEAKKRKRQLDAMSAQGLREEAETGDLNRLWRCAEVTLALFEPPSLFEREPIQSILHLSAREAGQFKKTKIYFENFDDHKAAAAVLRAALGKDNVRVDVPTSRRKLAKYDAQRLRKKRFIQWSMGGVAAAIILIALLAVLLRRSGPAPLANAPGVIFADKAPDGNAPEGAQPPAAAAAAAVPAGFVVVDAPLPGQEINKDVAKKIEQRERIKKLAQQAPPFDPAETPTMRPPLAD